MLGKLNLTSRRPIVIIPIICTVIIVSYWIIWIFLAFEFEHKVKEWVNEWQSKNYNFNYSNFEIEGFPFKFNVIIRTPEIASVGINKWRWGFERLILSQSVWSMKQIGFTLIGPHKLDFLWKKNSETFKFHTESLNVNINLSEGRPVSLVLFGGEIISQQIGRIETYTIGKARIKLFKLPRSTLGIDFLVNTLNLPSNVKLPLGQKIEEIYIKGRVVGGINSSIDQGSLSSWRDKGGIVEIDEFNLTYSKIILNSAGTLTIGQDFQPIGAFSAKIHNMDSAVDVLRKNGVIKSRDVLTIKLMLAAISENVIEGGNQYLKLALTIQDNAVYLGPIKIFKFKKMSW